MANILRYVEIGGFGERTGRQIIAKVVETELPPAADNARWRLDETFDLATQLMETPSFRDVIETVLGSQVSPEVMQAVAPTMEAMGVKCFPVDKAEDVAETFAAAADLAFNSRTSAAVLVGQRIIGAKGFGQK